MSEGFGQVVLDRVRRLARHRLARWVVLGAILLLVVKMVGRLPNDVEIEYHLGTAGGGLQRMEMRYLLEGTEVRKVAFSYASAPAGEIQRHPTQLIDGDYAVEVRLSYAGGKVKVLDRPLFVRGAGRVGIFLR